MLRAQFVPATAQAALEQAESRFNRIGVGVATDVFLRAVLDNLVLVPETCPPRHAFVGHELIGDKQIHILSYVFLEELIEDAPSDFLGMEQPQFPVALSDSDNRTLLGAAPTRCKAVSLPADVGLIHLDLPREFRFVGFRHCCPDAVAEVPCGLVAHPDRALNLAGGDTLFGLAEDGYGDEPLPERQVGIMEDSSRRHRELVMA